MSVSPLVAFTIITIWERDYGYYLSISLYVIIRLRCRQREEESQYFNSLFACFGDKNQEIKKSLIGKSNNFVEDLVRNKALAILN